ncbi:hypothetical protein LY41_002105, partial [Prauserella halophila]|nr:hypothetical protein [Prauserella halophila]
MLFRQVNSLAARLVVRYRPVSPLTMSEGSQPPLSLQLKGYAIG